MACGPGSDDQVGCTVDQRLNQLSHFIRIIAEITIHKNHEIRWWLMVGDDFYSLEACISITPPFFVKYQSACSRCDLCCAVGGSIIHNYHMTHERMSDTSDNLLHGGRFVESRDDDIDDGQPVHIVG